MIIRKNTKRDIKLCGVQVFVCAPCLGKTTLANLNPQFVDMDKLKSLYKYGHSVENHEATKGSGKRVVVNHDSFEYIQRKTFELLGEGKKLLFNAKPEFREFIYKSEIPYCLVYFHPDRLSEITDKMRNRGNNEEFISGFTYKTQMEYYTIHENCIEPAFKVVLEANEHVADILDLFY